MLKLQRFLYYVLNLQKSFLLSSLHLCASWFLSGNETGSKCQPKFVTARMKRGIQLVNSMMNTVQCIVATARRVSTHFMLATFELTAPQVTQYPIRSVVVMGGSTERFVGQRRGEERDV